MSTAQIPQQTPLHERVSQVFAKMPRAEQKVAAFLLHKGYEHTDLTLAQLAELAGVSMAVVIRMCKLLGYSGFRDFRLEWARIGARSEPKESAIPAVYVDVFHALRQSADLLTMAALEQAAAAILQCRQLFIYGSGGSSYVAHLAAATFNAVGRMSIPFTESVWQIYNRIYSDADTAILVISYGGRNSTIHRVLAADKARGATIITLTSDPGSDLAHMANIVLVTGGPTSLDVVELEMSPARVVQLAAVHALASATINMARKMGKDIRRVEGHLYDRRYNTLPC